MDRRGSGRRTFEVRSPIAQRVRMFVVVTVAALTLAFATGVAGAAAMAGRGSSARSASVHPTSVPSSQTIFSDDFESGNLSNWTSSKGMVVQSTTVFAGSDAAEANVAGTQGYALKSLPSTYTDVTFTTEFRIVSRSPSSQVNVLRFRTATPTNVLTLFVGSDSHLYTRNDIAGTNTYSSVLVSTGAWHQAIVHVVVGGATSSVAVTYDGAAVAQLTTTPNLGTTPVAQMILGDNTTGRTFDAIFDSVSVQVPDTSPPSTPGTLTAQVASSVEVDLSWGASTDNVGVASYDVYRNGVLATSVDGSATTFADTGRTPNTAYAYTVVARDGAGNTSPPSNEADVTTPTDSTPPSAPGSLTAQVISPVEVDLAWTASTDDTGVAAYDVYRNGTLAKTVDGTTTAYADTGLTPSTAYAYTVIARDAAGNPSQPSNEADATTPDDTSAPTAPSSLTAMVVSFTEIDLTWAASTDDVGVTAYDVFRDGSLLTTVPGGTTVDKDTTAMQDTTYSYTVVARDAAGNVSAPSNEAHAATPPSSQTIFSDDFESGNLSNWTSSKGMVVQSTTVFAGSDAAEANVAGTQGYALKSLPSTYTDVTFTTEFRIVSRSPSSQVNVLRFRTATPTNVLTLFVGSDSHLYTRNDIAGTNTYSSVLVSTGAWHQAIVHVVVGGATSSVAVTYDGAAVAQLTTTPNLGTTPVAQMILGDNTTGRTFDAIFDSVSVQVPGTPPPPPSPICSYAPATHAATVTLATDGASATLAVAGSGGILVNAASCDVATVTNTDTITVQDTSTGGSTSVVVDLSGGAFGPGFSGNEVKIQTNLGDGTGDAVTVAGGVANDTITAGSAGINLNAAVDSDPTGPDVTMSGVERLTLSGGDGNDTLSDAGGAGTGGSYAAGATFLGGNGEDRLIGGSGPDSFDGGDAIDTVDYSTRTNPVTVTIGDGLANDGEAAEGDNVMGTIEHVIGGAGNDTITGDDDANLLQGGPGDDHLIGGAGDDELRGEAGNDFLEGGGNDDLIVGGPGNDTEDGDGLDDVFVQSTQQLYGATDLPKTLAPGTTTTSSITIGDAPSKNYNMDLRVDIQDPVTSALNITLQAPDGTRDVMFNRESNGTQLTGIYFDSEEVTKISLAGSDPFSGRFHPEGSMETFNGKVVNGTWSLIVSNDTGGVAGTLVGWGLIPTYLTNTSDGTDVISGGSGVRDLVNYQGRSANLFVTMMSGADDGQAGENDNVGANLADVEDCYLANGNDTIYGLDDPVNWDDIRGGAGNDTIYGLAGDDSLRGQDNNDTIYGGDGNDTIQGNGGVNYIDGGNGSDWITYGAASSNVIANLSTGTGSWTGTTDTIVSIENLTGSSKNDTFTGTTGDNILNGGNGNDTLIGLDGSDTLDGGAGTDTLDGGPGFDFCRNGETKTNCEA